MAKDKPEIKDKEIQTTGFEERSKEFQDHVIDRSNVYEMVRNSLIDATAKAFSDKGIEENEGSAGVYGTEVTYGAGAKKGRYNATYSNKVKTLIEKIVTYGTKRIISQINIVFDPEEEMLHLTYNGTEGAVFRGHMNNDDPMGYMVRDIFVSNTKDKKQLKKDLKEFFEKITKREVGYILTTKLGVQDKIQTSLDSSMVEEQKTINSMNLSNLSNLSESDITNYFQNKINESLGKIKTIKEHKEDENSDFAKKLNTVQVGNKTLLYDEKIDEEKELEDEKIDEITSASSAGAFNTKYAFKKGGDFDKEMENENTSDPYFDKVPMGKDGWPPKGMEHNFEMGNHKQKLNINEAREILKPTYKLDTTRKKFFSEEENKATGINKRYLVTDQLSESEQYDKWKKLSIFESNDTIKRAEDVLSDNELSILKECACQDEKYFDEKLYLDREDAEEKNNEEFEAMNDDDYINIEKPNSFVILKIKKEDLMNESKRFIFDYNTGNYVINPTISQEEK
jgi:hypothetical protein